MLRAFPDVATCVSQRIESWESFMESRCRTVRCGPASAQVRLPFPGIPLEPLPSDSGRLALSLSRLPGHLCSLKTLVPTCLPALLSIAVLLSSHLPSYPRHDPSSTLAPWCLGFRVHTQWPPVVWHSGSSSQLKWLQLQNCL